MIEDFIESAIIIDDVEDEVSKLKKLLEEKDIWVKYFHPKNLTKLISPLKNRKIIFLDLYISETSKETEAHISEIRRILKNTLGKNFGTYGIVVWSAHSDEIDLFKSKVQKDADLYTLPLFIVGLNKTKYLKQDGFDDLFTDLNNILNKNIAASFFIQWCSLVNNGRDKAIHNIYSLIDDFGKQDKNLQYVLFNLAQNYTGIPWAKVKNYPLHIDAFKAFNDMMNYEITSTQKMDCKIFDDHENICFIGNDENYKKRLNGDYSFKDSILNLKDDLAKKEHSNNTQTLDKEIKCVFSKVNKKLLLDNINGDKGLIIPGNIYEILDDKNTFKLPNLPEKATPIILEISPPCDFANNNTINNQQRPVR
jgi:hypothetical protein